VKTALYYETASLADLYTWFASEAAPTSPTWERVCLWIAQNDAVQAQLATLPESKRQPNLFLAALKYLGATTEPGEDLASFVDAHWAEIEQLVVSRRTQTNEVGRCAVLAPVLAWGLPGTGPVRVSMDRRRWRGSRGACGPRIQRDPWLHSVR
jgi:hypothetical protein